MFAIKHAIIKKLLCCSMLLITTLTFAGIEHKVAAQANTLFSITLIEKNANQVRVSKNAHKDVDYRVCNHTKFTRTLAMPDIAGVELLDMGPSSCRKRFEAGLKSQECCLLKLRVDLRAQAALRRFSANGKNNFPQVKVVPSSQAALKRFSSNEKAHSSKLLRAIPNQIQTTGFRT